MKLNNYLKKVSFLIVALGVGGFNAFAQAPQGLNYQAIARDNTGSIIASHAVGLRLTITTLQSGGSLLYQETQTPTTNEFGLFTITLGGGTLSGGSPAFTSIPWSTTSPWLKVEMDPSGSTSYLTMGTSQLLSVPYALFAASTVASGGSINGTINHLVKFTGATTGGDAAAVEVGGNVGIGTTTPSHLLSVKGGATDAVGIISDTVSSGIGVAGQNTADVGTGAGIGVYGATQQSNGAGVIGVNFNSNGGTGVIGVGDNIVYTGPTTGGSAGSGGGLFYGANVGAYGESEADASAGVYGVNNGPAGSGQDNPGVYGQGYTGVEGATSADNGFGVIGATQNNSGGGLLGVATTGDGMDAFSSGGVFDDNHTGFTGVYGSTGSAIGAGVFGYSTGTSDDTYTAVGVEGETTDANGYGVATGGSMLAQDFYSTILQSSIKFFVIDNPLDPANKLLRHTSIESPEALNIYRGTIALNADGGAIVSLPDYFSVADTNFSYHLTPIGASAPNLYISREISTENTFEIAGGKPGMKVSWQVTAQRNDPFMKAHPELVANEYDKLESRKGRYINPEAFGQPKSQSYYFYKLASQSPAQTISVSVLKSSKLSVVNKSKLSSNNAGQTGKSLNLITEPGK